MNLRGALITQAPSLELQRAAQAEIARLDDRVQKLVKEVEALVAERDAAQLGLSQMTSEKYPYAHVRFDLSPAEKENAIADKLISLGWTPPAGALKGQP